MAVMQASLKIWQMLANAIFSMKDQRRHFVLELDLIYMYITIYDKFIFSIFNKYNRQTAYWNKGSNQ